MGVEAGNILRVVAHLSYQDEPILNVYHVRYGGTTTIANSAVVTQAAAWLNTAYTYLVPYMPTDLEFDYVEVWNITQDAPVGNTTWPTLTAGTDSTNDAYATQCAALVRFGTDVARSQGRKFIGVLTEGAVQAGGQLQTAILVPLSYFATHIVEGFTYSFEEFNPGNWNPTLSRFASWITAIITDRVCTQRRRRIGIGT